MGRLTEAAAAGGGASAARSAGPPPAPLSLSSTSPGCAAAMASSEEDGTNGGASEASEEREAVGKRRRLGLLATIWLTFYNIAMTAGWLVLAIAMIQNEESVVLFLVAWTVTEITRYSFYTFSLLDHLPYFIKWARWR